MKQTIKLNVSQLLIFAILCLFLTIFNIKYAQSTQFEYQSTQQIAQDDNDYDPQMERLYCREIDSLVYSYNLEIDADSFDIGNAFQMEEAAFKLIGDKFYTWKNTQSKYAWDYQAMIARCCY